MQWYLILILLLLFGTDPSENEKLRKLILLGVSFVWCEPDTWEHCSTKKYPKHGKYTPKTQNQ